jgi:hypothetical protein
MHCAVGCGCGNEALGLNCAGRKSAASRSDATRTYGLRARNSDVPAGVHKYRPRLLFLESGVDHTSLGPILAAF